jgi:uncharacterized phage protein (TIGR02218 family)
MKIGLQTNNSYVRALLDGQRQWLIGHLYTFTAVSGAVDYFTDLDEDAYVGGIHYKSGGLRIEGLRMKLAVGVNVDEQEVTIWASPSDTLFGGAFLAGMAAGLMDGGTIARDRAVWTPATGDLFQDIGQTPAAVWRMFYGYMSTIEEIGRASVRFKVKSPLVKLNINMPRNFYQSACLWSLYDQGCTLNRANFAQNYTFLRMGTPYNGFNLRQMFPVGGVSPAVGADELAYYQRGRLIFTSGVNEGLEATIDTNDGEAFYLAYPLVQVPSPGDTFTAYPGCSKAFTTCQQKFNNAQNFRGFDRVPSVYVSI